MLQRNSERFYILYSVYFTFCGAREEPRALGLLDKGILSSTPGFLQFK